MLDPQDRRLLLEALRPPEGHTLDCAIGTTYSLDLLAALTAPLAFTLFDLGDEEGRPVADPLAMLEALRRHAEHVSIFCHAGGIAIPKRHETLFGYLEDSIVQVVPPNPQGVFHPKIWALRFTAPDGRVFYRLVCLTRNLTFDRSWDTILVLNGELAQRRNAFADNHPLGDFFAALPGLAIRRPIPDRIQRDVDRLQDEVRRVRFDLPDGFAAITFWPLGIDGARRWPFVGRIDRMLVISPFLSPRLLSRLAKDGDKHVLVSRLESLEALDDPAALGQFERVFFMNPSADAPNEIDEETNAGGERSLSGLHAKLYVADAGWDARVWVGSANATERAFGANVEFLIELVGAKSRCGVDAVLGGDESVPFAGLLQLFEPGNQAPGAEPISEQLERHLELARRAVASAPLYLRVDPGDGPEQIRLGLFGRGAEAVNLPSDLDIRCWPITLKEDVAALSLSAGTGLLADFGLLSFEALTSFLAFEIAGTVDGVPGAVRFVLNLPIEGAPADRRDRILRSLLRDPDRVLRFLFLLLSEDEIEARDALFSGNGQGPGTKGLFGPEDGSALFEVLVSTLDRNPAKLDEVARLIDDLRKSPEGEALLPPGFNSVWQPIWTARQRLKDEYAGPTP